jgi:transcriptional regulator with XRE-family HTH domain
MGKRNPAQTKRLLARNIRRLRNERGWSQQDLAFEAKVRQAFVSSLEHAKANPSLELLDRVAAAFDLSVADLLSPM